MENEKLRFCLKQKKCFFFYLCTDEKTAAS